MNISEFGWNRSDLPLLVFPWCEPLCPIQFSYESPPNTVEASGLIRYGPA